MVIPEGYKQTEIGVIPEEWKLATIGDIANFQGGSQPDIKHFSSQQRKDRIRLIQIRDYKTDKYVTYIPISLAKRFCDKDDIMIGRYGPPIFQILRGLEGAYNVALIKAIPKNVHREFLYYTLKAEKLFEYIELLSRRSSGQTGVDLDGLRGYFIGLPSFEEQEHIANALSDVDSMISSLEKLIKKKKAVKQGAMQELLTGKKRLSGFTGEWRKLIFGNLCYICRGGSPRPIQNYLTTSDDGYNWIKIGDVEPNAKYITSTQEKIIESGISKSRRVYKGDFILSNSMSFGRPYILKIDGCIHDGWLAIQNYFNYFDTDFLYYTLGSEYVFEQYIQMAAGSSVQNLNKDKVAKLELFVPPIEEQSAIASILSDIDNEIDALEQKLKKARQLKQGMMQQLLTGKIRLV